MSAPLWTVVAMPASAGKCWQVLASAGKCNGYADELAQLQNDKAADTDNQSLLRYSSTVRLN